MSLSSGARLGPYEILSAIGAGGMGEVYKARDTQLDRWVAIKILPPEVSDDLDRRARFDREAKTIAGLTHPNICTLYGVGQHGGATFLVMEYLAGETLAERLRKGPLPLEQALIVATEVADALSAAHRQGVVHRDLKPGNVMLTKSGAKLLDFGLAKATGHGERPAAERLTSAPTATRPLTGEGVIVGTLEYMAPEQVEGKPADARTDLWALGAILYEMLTGRRAFEGKSAAGLIAAILSAEPAAISTLQPLTPPGLDRLVRQCLAKDPDDRWQNAHDVASDLRWVRETGSAVALPGIRPRHPQGTRLAWGVALIAVLLAVASTAIAAVLWIHKSSASIVRPPIRALLSDQRPAWTGLDPQPSFAMSNDGQRVALVAERGGVRHLYLREMSSLQSREIPGSDNAMAPFFSPDGQRIGFFADGHLKAVSLAGGTPVVLADVLSARGASWAPDDTIIFSPATDAGLWSVPGTGGPARVLAQPDAAKGERGYRWPKVLPGGGAVVFTLATSDIQSFDDGRLVVRSLRNGEQHELIRGGSFATYSVTGHLLFVRAGALMAVPFDVARQAVTGSVKPVLDGLVTYPVDGAAEYAIADDGTLVYMAGRSISREATLSWIDRTGKAKLLAVPPAAYQDISLAPNGREAAVDIDGANASIWLLDLERTSMTRLTTEWSNNGPFWAPDETRVAFSSARGGARRLFWQAADGRGLAEPLTPPLGVEAREGSWAPDGRTFIFGVLTEGTGWDILASATNGARDPQPLVRTRANERAPRISPDGRWVAYQSDETGNLEVYVLPYPGPGRKVRISADGGTQPVWARDGRELFYRNGDAMMSVTIQTSPSFTAARPRALFRTLSQYPFDVASDGRFLMIEDPPPPVLGPLTVALNWGEEMKANVPAKN